LQQNQRSVFSGCAVTTDNHGAGPCGPHSAIAFYYIYVFFYYFTHKNVKILAQAPQQYLIKKQ
jgi:hypothetical protein